MNIIGWIWILLQVLIGYNLIFPLLMYIIHSLKRNREEVISNKRNQFDYAIIVTAYEETALLKPLVESILNLNYENYLVYIVADKCDVSDLKFEDKRVILLRPETVLASNIKSHFYAINHFKRKHEILTIIDSDNLVEGEYLNELNICFNQGFNAVQGKRAAKETKSVLARLDGIRDIYYHFYDGKLLFELGSSATLSGSGMAFKTELYRECLDIIQINGAGFDKVLQTEIVKRNETIAFTSEAIVYDEKTSHSQQLVKQRSRWINTWFKYFSFGFDLIKLGTQNRSTNQFLFGLVLLRPPLFIFISLSVFCLIVSILLKSAFTYFWLLAFLAFLFSFFIALKKNKNANISYSSLWAIPQFIFLQFISLLFVRNANKRSVATKHHTELYERNIGNG